jgi:hypothetical protein
LVFFDLLLLRVGVVGSAPGSSTKVLFTAFFELVRVPIEGEISVAVGSGVGRVALELPLSMAMRRYSGRAAGAIALRGSSGTTLFCTARTCSAPAVARLPRNS